MWNKASATVVKPADQPSVKRFSAGCSEIIRGSKPRDRLEEDPGALRDGDRMIPEPPDLRGRDLSCRTPEQKRELGSDKEEARCLGKVTRVLIAPIRCRGRRGRRARMCGFAANSVGRLSKTPMKPA